MILHFYRDQAHDDRIELNTSYFCYCRTNHVFNSDNYFVHLWYLLTRLCRHTQSHAYLRYFVLNPLFAKRTRHLLKELLRIGRHTQACLGGHEKMAHTINSHQKIAK